MRNKLCVGLFISFITAIVVSFTTKHTLAEQVPLEDSSSQMTIQSVMPETVQWITHPTIAGVESAIALGDPTNSELYVLLGKMNTGAIFPTHTHPDDRITTVISGVMYYGIGEQFVQAEVQPYPAGSVVYTPAGTPHFMWAKDGGAVMQETGMGPTDIQFIADIQN
ncbi:MAG: cupin domain-containing protein [Cyanobacteria bacterium J06636_16]